MYNDECDIDRYRLSHHIRSCTLDTMATMTDGALCAALRPAQPLRPRGLPRRRGTTLPSLAASVHARIITSPFCGSRGRLYLVFIVKEWSTGYSLISKKTMILFDINLNTCIDMMSQSPRAARER